MWELTDLRKSASVLKESDGWLKMSGDRRFLDDIDCDPEARDVPKSTYGDVFINAVDRTTPPNTPSCIAFGGNKPVMTGDATIYSSDGINWTTTRMPFATGGAITYGNGKFVATRGSNTDVIAYSLDGITWFTSTLPVTTYVKVKDTE